MREGVSFLIKSGLAVALAVSTGLSITPSWGQDLDELSSSIGEIERGFWTRQFFNDMAVTDTSLVISHTTFTRVEWQADGVPGRHVTDTLTWTLKLAEISEVSLSSVPGDVLLEGSDQDSYCPLTAARFSCVSDATDCSDDAVFYVCRYNAPELDGLLRSLQALAPQMVITAQSE